MLVQFDSIEEKAMHHFRGGQKDTMARLFTDSLMKIMHGRLEPGASIGLHAHDTSSEVIYVLAGRGKVLCDGEWEAVSTGSCHYCPKGHEHSLINDSQEDLVFFAVVPEHGEK